MMKFETLAIPDIKLLFPKKFRDNRGFFSETYNETAYASAGITSTFVQDNYSLSNPVGVLRGLHYQCAPFAQDKLVYVTHGRIFDVAVDIRAGSLTFGKWVSAELSADEWNQIFIPKGFAHGFMTITPDAEVHYKVSAPYAPDSECSIMWNDPDLGIGWPLTRDAVNLSPKDAQAMSFADYCRSPAF